MITDRARALAHSVASAMDVQPRILTFGTDDRRQSAYVGYATGWPTEAQATAFTVDVSSVPLELDNEEYELVMIGARGADDLVDATGNLALAVRRRRFIPAPGAVWEEALRTTESFAARPHALLVYPETSAVRWKVEADDVGRVVWLQVLPIDDSELASAAATSTDDLLAELRVRGRV